MTERLKPAEWKIEDTSDGWVLSYRYHLPLATILPGYFRRNLVYFIPMSLFFFAIYSYLFYAGYDENLFRMIVSLPLILFLTFGTVLVYWPFRFGRGYAHYQEARRLRYYEGNRTEQLCAKKNYLNVAGSVFSIRCLSTLEAFPIASEISGFGIHFDGEHVKNVVIVSWPGLPEATAREIVSVLQAHVP